MLSQVVDLRKSSLAVIVLIPLLATSLAALGAPLIRIVAPDGTPLRGAHIRVELLDGRTYEFVLDPNSPFRIRDVPLGVLKVTVVSWKGVPVGYTEQVKVGEKESIVVPKIKTLTVRAVGSRGQGLEGAIVRILYRGKLVEEGSTDGSGVYGTLLPEEQYTVEVSYAGKTQRRSVRVPSEEEFRFDVFLEVGGSPFSLGEVFGIALLVVIIVIAMVVIYTEYSNWRGEGL